MGLSLSLWLIQTAAGPPAAPCSSAFTSLAVPTSSRLRIILDSSPAAEQEDDARSHWSSVRRSPHFLVSACKRKATRSPAELTTDGVRAERGAASGLHVWEVLWDPRHRGSHAVVGISVKNCPLQTSGYKVLAGGDEQSWGWELQSNKLWHGGQVQGPYPVRDLSPTTLCIPKRVLIVLDADVGTLGYVVDGFFLGVAFRDLPRGTELFPAVSSVRGGARIELRYLNGASGEPPSLMSLCRLSVQQNMNQNQLENLHLPPLLQRYLLNTQ